MTHVPALLGSAAPAMTPLETILAVSAFVSFVLAVIAFLVTVWKISWAVRGWVEMENQRAKNNHDLTEIVVKFTEAQKDANAHQQKMMESMQVRQNNFDEEREELYRSVRAMNSKLRAAFEGEEGAEQKPINFA